MTITFKDVVKLAKGAHSMPALRSVVFDGKSAMTAAQLDWMVGVPCEQPNLTEPVVVPVDAIQAHLLKSRHLVVMPDHLTNGQGLVTPFNPGKVDYSEVLHMLPKPPEGEAVTFELELDALDRVLIASGVHDIRYYLNGVLFDLSDGMLVGCDGHRLHTYKNRVPRPYKRKVVDGVPMGELVEVALNRDPLKWIVGSADVAAKVTIWNAKRPKVDGQPVVPQALLQTKDAFVWVRKAIEGKFPDWRRVLPAVVSRPVWATVNPAKLADTVAAMGKVVKLESDGKWGGVTIDFGRGQVYGKNQDQVMPLVFGLNSDRVDLNLGALTEELWMGVCATYLEDVADCVTAEAQWRLDHTGCKNQGLLVTDGDFSGVVMGLRGYEPERAPKVSQEAAEVAPVVPVAQTEPEAAQDAQEDPETAPAEPCPAAVDAMAAQLVGQLVKSAQEAAKKAPRKARKPAQVAKVPQAEPVDA